MLQRFSEDILRAVKQRYAPDLRALSLMRICLALVVLADLFIRLDDLEAHYTDAGIWPRDLASSLGWGPGYWSVHLLGGSTAFQLSLFVLHLIAALALLLGFRTRVATIAVWLLTLSLHNRNLFILQSGDDLLRMTLFWGIFLPLGSYYSLDARRQQHSSRILFLPWTGYLLLIVSVYFFTVILKSSSEWRAEGSALYYALSLEQLRLPAADLIYGHPTLLKYLTWLVYGMEACIPLLILIPGSRGTGRWYAFILIVALHTAIALMLFVGLFPFISIAAAIGMLPSPLMDRFEKLLSLKTRSQFMLMPVKRLIQLLVGAVSVLVISASLLINASAVPAFDYQLHSRLQFPANMIGLRQHWGMFSPGVLKTDGWYVLHGLDSLGRQWDLRTNTDYVDYTKPEKIVSHYRNDRWRKLAENMQRDDYTFLRPLYGKYMLRQWNRKHPEKKLQTLNLYFMEKRNAAAYGQPEIKKVLYCVCNDR